jgi:hypothetical protein
MEVGCNTRIPRTNVRILQALTYSSSRSTKRPLLVPTAVHDTKMMAIVWSLGHQQQHNDATHDTNSQHRQSNLLGKRADHHTGHEGSIIHLAKKRQHNMMGKSAVQYTGQVSTTVNWASPQYNMILGKKAVQFTREEGSTGNQSVECHEKLVRTGSRSTSFQLADTTWPRRLT